MGPAELLTLMFSVLGNLMGGLSQKGRSERKSELVSWVRKQAGSWKKVVEKPARVFHIQLNLNSVTLLKFG